jgi:hypothetical protein
LHRFTASNPFLAISKLSPNIFKILDINFNEILSSSATSIFNFVVQNVLLLAVVDFFFQFHWFNKRDFKTKYRPLSGLFSAHILPPINRCNI